jgi:DNA-directed RNA polymerase specialized sigma24 family protein
MHDSGEDFAAWVEPCLPRLRQYAAGLVGADEADRLAQDALALAWRRRGSFDPRRDDALEWLLEIARERRERMVRRRRQLPVVLLASVMALVGAGVAAVVLLTGSSSTDTSAEPPAGVEVARSCRDGDLAVERTETHHTLRTTYVRIRLVLAGASPCRLRGFPDVLPLEHGRRMDLEVAHRPDDALLRGLSGVDVRDGRGAVVTMALATSHVCPAAGNDRLLIILPGSARPFAVPGFGPTSCADGAAPTTLDVFPIRPAARSGGWLADCTHVSFSAPPECV